MKVTLPVAVANALVMDFERHDANLEGIIAIVKDAPQYGRTVLITLDGEDWGKRATLLRSCILDVIHHSTATLLPREKTLAGRAMSHIDTELSKGGIR